MKHVCLLVIFSLVFYPVYFILTAFNDSFLGNNEILLAWLFESKRALLVNIIYDYLCFFLAAVVLGFIVLLPRFFKMSNNIAMIWGLLTALLVGLICVYYIPAFQVSVLLVTTLLSVILSKLLVKTANAYV